MLTDARESLLQSTPVENDVIVQQQIPIGSNQTYASFFVNPYPLFVFFQDETADFQRPEPEKPAITRKKRIKLEPSEKNSCYLCCIFLPTKL